jgi:hypothetical protein
MTASRTPRIRRIQPRRAGSELRGNPCPSVASVSTITASAAFASACCSTLGTFGSLIAFPEQPSHGNFEATGDCCRLVIHQVACLVLDAGDRRLVQRHAACSQPARQIVLRHWGITFKTRFADAPADDVPVRELRRFLHRHVQFTCPVLCEKPLCIMWTYHTDRGNPYGVKNLAKAELRCGERIMVVWTAKRARAGDQDRTANFLRSDTIALGFHVREQVNAGRRAL